MRSQPIARVRRQYNRWVADQTIEDYSLRFTADRARRWSSFRVGNTALGAISFLACEAIGGSVTLTYGFTNAMVAILAVSLLIFATSLPIGYYAAKFGVDMDLLTRGAGFGYIGSTVTSLIYAGFTFILFAVEATIMSQALSLCFGIPLWLGHVISATMVLPIAVHGIRLISRMQLWTQPIWLVLQLAPLAYVAVAGWDTVASWSRHPGTLGASDGSFDLLLFGMAASILLSLIPQIGEQVDYLRFLPDRRREPAGRWWAALLVAGPGWIFIGAAKLVAGSFLAYVALSRGIPADRAAQPPELYRMAFTDLFHSPGLALALTGLFVIVCQTKINVTNAYAGSIAWSNFFSRLTHSHPGRVVWLSFNVMLALMLMEMGIFEVIEHILGLYANFAVAWIGALTADLVINKPLGLSPPAIEFRRAHLYDVNPVGIGAMLISVAVSTALHFGAAGEVARTLAPIVGFVIAFGAAPAIARATGGRYYIARPADCFVRPGELPPSAIVCSICENSFEPNDMSHCPAYAAPICSLCCSLDMRCHDRCKEKSRLADQAAALAARLLPAGVVRRLGTRVGRFLATLLVLVSGVGFLLALVGAEYGSAPGADRDTIRITLEIVFAGLLVIMGLAAWAFVLAQESRRVAEEESERQTAMLLDEIEAHKRTDAALQKAKEVAEAANVAKTRFIAGLSHEIRTPLNSINGYAQLLERGGTRQPGESVRVIRRSAEHIIRLVDGLLDIAKIETGAAIINRNVLNLPDYLDQMVDMFRLQATAKGIEFRYHKDASLPAFVHADEKRLSQILMNLLSNAIKYTERGHVDFTVRHRYEVTEFEIADTGVGIAPEDRERIFEPFERGSLAGGAGAAPGTGLGLTITRLLTHVLGGDLSFTSEPGRGSTFKVRMLLSEARPSEPARIRPDVRGYAGERRTLLICDDDPSHLDFMRDTLAPLGFTLFFAPHGRACLEMAGQCHPDLLLLDISMPGLNGWQVARALRQSGMDELAILMVSADVHDLQAPPQPDMPHDDFVIKPVEIPQLLERLETLLGLDWVYDEPDMPAVPPPGPNSLPLAAHHVDALRRLAEIGHLRGIEAKLAEIRLEAPHSGPLLDRLRGLAQSFDFDRFAASLGNEGEEARHAG
jgi:signal transduction histidine kinase